MARRPLSGTAGLKEHLLPSNSSKSPRTIPVPASVPVSPGTSPHSSLGRRTRIMYDSSSAQSTLSRRDSRVSQRSISVPNHNPNTSICCWKSSSNSSIFTQYKSFTRISNSPISRLGDNSMSPTDDSTSDAVGTPSPEGGVVVRRIVILGFKGIGKSALCSRFVYNTFSELYSPTIVAQHSIVFRFGDQNIEIDIQDTQGRDHYDAYNADDAIDIHGFVLCYSIADKHSFLVAQSLNEKIINAKGYNNPPLVLVGTQLDKAATHRRVSLEEGRTLARSWDVPHIECSSFDNINITPIFHAIIGEIDMQLNPPPNQSCNLL